MSRFLCPAGTLERRQGWIGVLDLVRYRVSKKAAGCWTAIGAARPLTPFPVGSPPVLRRGWGGAGLVNHHLGAALPAG